ncbi:hypothetical protein [Bradyrhizobium retamae]|uniref:Uncharacterized protein n=1 Tax=Bradyrhizobium retamae TaxID=1300035 RepID=A0A0R3MWK3_9BRAD|nr:hypothetical protein [Bradyrhizobium retamae]KRR24235.1 hypothetical protein CQ13_26115 [Bradyrhizobium retamae]
MRASTAFFAGAGTVVVAVAAGLGGGYLAANIVSPPTQVISKLERRMSAEPIPVSTEPSQPVPYLAATAAAANTAPAQEQPQTQPQQTQPLQPQTQPQPQTAAAAPAANNASTEEKTANNAAAAQPVPPPPKPSKPAEQAGENTAPPEKAAAPQEAFAKARDADLKRAAAEQRRAERRQRWADKRRFQQPRGQDLEGVEAQVREATEPRRIIIREEAFAGEPARIEMPRIRLFDQD